MQKLKYLAIELTAMAQQLIQLIERNERKRQKNIVIPNLNISKTSIAFKVNVTTTVPIY